MKFTSFFGDEITSRGKIEAPFYIKGGYTANVPRFENTVRNGLKRTYDVFLPQKIDILMAFLKSSGFASFAKTSVKRQNTTVFLKFDMTWKKLKLFWVISSHQRKEKYFTDLYFHLFHLVLLFDCCLFHNLPYQVNTTPSNNRKIIQYVHILFDWGVLCVSKRDHYRIFIFLYLSLKTYSTESDVKKWLIVLSYPLLWKLFLCIFDNDKKIKNWEFSTQLHNSSHQSFCIWHLELSRTFFVMVKMQFFTHKRLDLLELI